MTPFKAKHKKRHEYGTLTPYTYGCCIPYLHFATYVEHMKNALELFPREQFLFLDTQDLKNSPQSITEKCFEFLDLPNFIVDTTKKNIGKYPSNLTNKAYEEKLQDIKRQIYILRPAYLSIVLEDIDEMMILLMCYDDV